MAEIILKEYVRNLGKIGQIVKVANGYAFNFLIPSGKALPATKENLEVLEKQKHQMLEDDKKKKEFAQTLVSNIPTEIYLTRPVNENGLLYGTISAKDIIEQVSIVTNKHNVHFASHIQKYGVYSVEIELHHDVIVKTTLSISDTLENAHKQISVFNAKKTIKKPSNTENKPE